jgi:hypothetical protein
MKLRSDAGQETELRHRRHVTFGVDVGWFGRKGSRIGRRATDGDERSTAHSGEWMVNWAARRNTL